MTNFICLFEDENVNNLLPLVYLRPVYDLRCGILTLREKIALNFPKTKLIFHIRNYLKNAITERYPLNRINEFDEDSILFINGRAIFNDKLERLILNLKEDFILKKANCTVAAKLSKKNISKILMSNSEFLHFNNLISVHTEEVETEFIDYPWDLINKNGKQIINDFELLAQDKKKLQNKFKSVEIINKKNVFISKGAQIDPFVVLDASGGPIYIDKNVRIMPHSYIQGPSFIGEGSTIKAHASIYHNTSIGEICKIGGEVESSVIHSYSNKQHEGFLGHAYIGSWVNIGADTNNSDLKNNYSSVEVYINGKKIDSGLQFVGLIMGDHSKTAINTMFNTGTVVGVSCNIFGSGFPAKYIPSFTWGGSDFLRTYNFEKALEVAKLAAQRRNILLSKAEGELLKKVFEITKDERVSHKIH